MHIKEGHPELADPPAYRSWLHGEAHVPWFVALDDFDKSGS